MTHHWRSSIIKRLECHSARIVAIPWKAMWASSQAIIKTTITHCGLGDFNEILEEYFSRQLQWLMAWDTCCKIALRRMSLDLTDDKSTLVQVMAWCRQATSHYLSQCWPRSLTPYGATRPHPCSRQVRLGAHQKRTWAIPWAHLTHLDALTHLKRTYRCVLGAHQKRTKWTYTKLCAPKAHLPVYDLVIFTAHQIRT